MKKSVGAMALLLAQITNGRAGQSVLTRSYDNGRTGANTSETVLSPAAILERGIRKVRTLRLKGDDPRIEAQPLYVPGMLMPDSKRHDVLYVFSMSNNIWAFDINTGALVWPHSVSLGKPFLPAPNDAVDIHHINKSFGILSTPVIDLVSSTIYAVNWIVDDHNNRVLHLNAIRLRDGQPRHPPLTIQASFTNTAGQQISLNPVQKQRAALLLVPLRDKPVPPAHKMLYVALTGAEDPPASGDPRQANHGWVVAFDVDTWEQKASWMSTPSSFGGGIWQASQGPAADEQGNIYFMTANGGFLTTPQPKDFNGVTDFAEGFIKLSYSQGPQGASLTLVDWFLPFRDLGRKKWQTSEVAPFPSGYDYQDQDLGSGAPVLPPGSGLVLGAGKDGVLYVMDRNNMGKVVGDFSKLKAPPIFFTFDPDPSVAAYQGASPIGNLDFKPMLGVKTHHLHGSPVCWESSAHGLMLFVWGENGNLRAFTLDPSGKATPLAHGEEFASANLSDLENNTLGGMPGAMLALTSDGKNNGIVWATAPVDGDANLEPVSGIIRAYDATTFATRPNPDGTPRLRKLWQRTGFTYSKFCTPVVVDGKIIVPTYDGVVNVYALNPPGQAVTSPR
jgi:outer membrane protein assembly factor BamB